MYGNNCPRRMTAARTIGRGSVRLSRRTVLRAAGAGVALPFLDAMLPAVGRAAVASAPRRMVAIHIPLGMMPRFFFPGKFADPGKAEAVATPLQPPRVSSGNAAPASSSRYLDLLRDLSGEFTAFNGLSHPGVGGGHAAGVSFLSGATGPGLGTFRNSESLDQFVAGKVGVDTRFPSLVLGVQKSAIAESVMTVSISRSGVGIPAELSPRRLYRSLFVAGTPDEQAATMRRIAAGDSVLDLVGARARALDRAIPAADRARLDQYLTSVREVERRLARSLDWEKTPKPQVDAREPADLSDHTFVIEKSKLMFDLMRLALQTDSTRAITLYVSTFSTIAHVPGVKTDTHHLSHHGNEPEKLAQLQKVEEAQMLAFAAFLRSLRDVKEGDGTLLDHTQVLYGSCLGNAAVHSNSNLPIILAGGGYRHRGYLAFDEKRNEPLANLFVSMLQRLGIEADAFASSTGSLRGLDIG
jgi:hypothetical protein